MFKIPQEMSLERIAMQLQPIGQTNLNERARRALVKGYSDLVQAQLEGGSDAFFLNFMFNHIPGSRDVKKHDVMTQEGNHAL
jgi:hypothetical protein